MNAFFYVDKPQNITSFWVLREMRKLLWIRKIGHSGTLDPLATGGLIVASGNYTKLITYLEKDTKTYQATIMLNGTSPSYDSDTEVSFISHEQQEIAAKDITKEVIETVLDKNFSGIIHQVPPKYSALKIDGKKALERVKSWEDITMKSREVKVLSYKILSYSYPKLEVEFHVSAGTYIRSLAHDLGSHLGTWGYISALRRTKVWDIDISLSTPLVDINACKAVDVWNIFPGRIYEFQDTQVYTRLADGQRVRWDFSFPENNDIFLSDGEQILYVVEYKNGVLHPRKKIA